MIESVSYLNIRPIYRYGQNSNRIGQTTMSGFDALLANEVKSSSKSSSTASASGSVSSGQTTSAVQTVSSQTTSTEESQTDDTAANTEEAVSVLYRDPRTGATVQYIDVSKDTNRVLETTSTVQTTSASDMKSSTPYDAYFKEAAEQYGVSESLLKGIAKAESDFNPNDVSSAGAIGIMQLMPGTAAELGVTNAYDPRQNILGGAKCIKNKLDEFHGDLRLALAAYNAGSGAVKRNGGVPSYCTTYVNRVISYKKAYETAEAVG